MANRSRPKQSSVDHSSKVPLRILAEERNRAVADSYASSTLFNYRKALSQFTSFLISHGLSNTPPISADAVGDYLAYLHMKEVNVSIMKAGLTAIAWRHKTLRLLDPTKDYNVKRMMISYVRNAPAVKRASPLTFKLLEDCLDHIHCLLLSPYDALLVKCILLTCYYGCLRIGEACISNNPENTLKNNCTEFVSLRGEKFFKYTLTKFKLSKEPVTLAFCENKLAKHCPLKALIKYSAEKPKGCTYFFSFLNGSPVKREFVVKNLDKLTSAIGLDSAKYTSHSLRAGRATDMGEAGVSEHQIRSAGRWRSDAYKCYLRFEVLPPPQVS